MKCGSCGRWFDSDGEDICDACDALLGDDEYWESETNAPEGTLYSDEEDEGPLYDDGY